MNIIDVASPTIVYDSYWHFAAERQAVLFKRVAGALPPWTSDQIIANHRFTNAYRVADRVSQFLITDVIRKGDQDPTEIVFRVLLFKLFNKIETWTFLKDVFDCVEYATFDVNDYASVLTQLRNSGVSIYNAAYMMPSPRLGETSKHADHLKLISIIMSDGFVAKMINAKTLEELYKLILSYQSMGPFLAYQMAIDLNYTDIIDFDEDEFIVPGPGAIDGISKCFANASSVKSEDIIREMVNRQEQEFATRNLNFQTLYNRRLKLIDCQNLFCEISKYARIKHPEFAGIAGRTKIKQKYNASLPRYENHHAITLPQKWLNCV